MEKKVGFINFINAWISYSEISYFHKVIFYVGNSCPGPFNCPGESDRFFSFPSTIPSIHDEVVLSTSANSSYIYDMRVTGHTTTFVWAAYLYDSGNYVRQRPALSYIRHFDFG